MGRTKREYLRGIWTGKACALCGGKRPAESAEHAPPTIIFHGGRPRGLEVPACERCNSGSGALDQTVAMVALSSDPEILFRDRQMTDNDYKIVKGTANNAHTLTRHKGCALSLRHRKRIEEAFGRAKTIGGAAQTAVRGIERGHARFIMTLAAGNLARLPKLLAA